jgi:photosystem II stability/assembly factor-like uncharacterized protein
MVSFNPAKTGSSRVFIIEGRARPDHRPEYQSAMKAGSPSQSFGDIEKIEVPSSDEYGKFIEVGSIRGAVERVSITLTGRYALDLKSELLRMARAGCAVDVQINLGECTDPSDWNRFAKKVVLEDAFLTSWESEDLGALGSDEQAKVDESADISARDIYELVEVSWAERGGDIVTNELVDNVICDTPSCGDCESESDGCERMFALSTAAGGSPSTPPDVVFSLDSGVTWQAHDIDSMNATDAPDEIDCLGVYLVVVSEDSASLHYALLSEHDGTTDPDWTEVTAGFVAGGAPRAISSDPSGRTAFIVGAGGYIYSTQDPTAGVTVLDAGVAHPLGVYNAVDALSETFAVAVGNAGIIARTENGTTWSAVATTPVGVGINLNTVAVKSSSEWLIGTSDGNLYYTNDSGVTWTVKAFNQSGAGVVRHIEIVNDTVMYMAHDTAAPLGRILRSTNGGYDWVVVPEGVGSLPANDRVNAVAGCTHNPDISFGVGLADNATDGFLVVGTD